MAGSGQRVAYVRVSSVDQNAARQLEAIGECDEVFTEQMSARSREDRPALAAMLRHIRRGDTVVVSSMDRLARSVIDLKNLVEEVRAEGATITFLKEQQTYGPDKNDPYANLMLAILGGIAEFERDIIRERQREGIVLAKTKGTYDGRRKALTPEQVSDVRKRIAAGEKKAAIARDLGVARSTLYTALTAKPSQKAKGVTR